MAAILSAILIFLGVAGSVLPFLPGPPLALTGLILYGYSTDFTAVSGKAILIFALLAALSFVFDIFAPGLAAKGRKASKSGAIGAIIGTALGVVFWGPLGAFLGPFVGGFVGEYLKMPDSQRALRTAWGAFLGFVFSALFKLVVVLAMAGYFVYGLFR